MRIFMGSGGGWVAGELGEEDIDATLNGHAHDVGFLEAGLFGGGMDFCLDGRGKLDRHGHGETAGGWSFLG